VGERETRDGAGTWRRHAVAVLACFGLVAGACANHDGGDAVGPDAPGPAAETTVATGATTEPAPPADLGVGQRHLEVVDEFRPTPDDPVKGRPGSPVRRVPVELLYPAATPATDPNPAAGAPPAAGRFPLVVFAHGNTTSGPIYITTVMPWVRAGYAVALPTFPVTSGLPANPASDQDYRQQSRDVGNVITEVLALDRRAGDALNGHLAADQVAVAGHSLGGTTSVGFLNTCCLDARVRAVVTFSLVRQPFPGGSYQQPPNLPLLLIHGERDNVFPFTGSLSTFNELTGPRALLSLRDADHFTILTAPVTIAATLAFLDLALSGRTGRIGPFTRELAATPGAELDERAMTRSLRGS
jgi:pimeloyl-ACP methyl ester carboxylesterase